MLQIGISLVSAVNPVEPAHSFCLKNGKNEGVDCDHFNHVQFSTDIIGPN